MMYDASKYKRKWRAQRHFTMGAVLEDVKACEIAPKLVLLVTVLSLL